MENRKRLRKALCIFLSPLIVLFGGTILTVLLFKEIIEEIIESRKKPVPEPELDYVKKEKIDASPIKKNLNQKHYSQDEGNANTFLQNVEYIPEFKINLGIDNAFSTHFALMTECYERILIDLLNETTKDDTIIIHKAIYERLVFNCARMKGPNVIIYTLEDYKKAYDKLITMSRYSNWPLFLSNPKDVIEGIGIKLINPNYVCHSNNTTDEVGIFDALIHEPYMQKFKDILNKRGICMGYYYFIDEYQNYFISNYPDSRSPKSRHAIGISQKVTKGYLMDLISKTVESLGSCIANGYDLNFLVASLTEFIEYPEPELLNELVTRVTSDLPWVINSNPKCIKAHYLTLSEANHLIIETKEYIYHCKSAHYESNIGYIPPFLRPIKKDNQLVTLLGIEMEANSDCLILLDMYYENIVTIDNFIYNENELKRAHLNNIIDAENLYSKIKGNLLQRLDTYNQDDNYW